MKPKGNKRINPRRAIGFLLIIATGTLVVLSIKRTIHRKNPSNATIVLPAPSPINPEESARLKDSCSQWYQKKLEKTCFNGGMIVAKNGNIIFEKYQGEAKLGSGIPFTDTTPIHIASASKPFTAMAILKLLQEKLLSLDDAYSKYFPDFNYPGVTIRTLLNHRSGLPNYTAFMDQSDWDKSRMLQNKDVLDFLIKNRNILENIGNPDRHFFYCNTNYALLALLIEKISGMSYKEFMESTFFRPLNMLHTFVRTAADSDRVNPSYDYRGAVIPDNFLDMVNGDKNIYSTARDMLTWDKALRSNLIFTPQTMELAYTPYSNEKPGIRNYGLGWRMNIYPNGKKLIYHNGWWHGNNASFTRMIEEDATIIILGSRFTKSIYKGKELTRIFYQYELTDDDE